MGVLSEQIKKAETRAIGLDLPALAAAAREKPPAELATKQAQRDRLDLLAQTLGDRGQAELAFERLIEGDELQPINYLPHGAVAARPICRLTMSQPRGFATGFLVAPQVLLTNNHVFPTASSAKQAFAEFDLELDVRDKPKIPKVFNLRPDNLFLTSRDLDFSLVAVEPTSRDGAPLETYGFLPLIGSPGKAIEGEWLTIIQHPGGGQKQVCIRENKLLTRTDEVLWYSTDTLGGSSGSPVFNNSWQVVALHHKGVPEMKNGVIQTVDGRDYDPARDADESSIKWKANEGIRISRLVSELRKMAPAEQMLEPIFSMTPSRAQTLVEGFALGEFSHAPPPINISLPQATTPPVSTPQSRMTPIMSTRAITLTLEITDDGRVSLRQPEGAQESFLMESTRPSARASRPPEYDFPFDQDYSSAGPRKGFDVAFLGKGFEVHLPDLNGLAADATKPTGSGHHGPYVLDYMGYSVVMHAKRKLAIYTAASIDGGGRFRLGRPHDEWRYDPRIDRSAQIGAFYYANNQFDRGHLTRYEDMQYGVNPTAALQTAADTLHFTNCSPQHAKFNQGKQLWQGLEQHVLEQSIRANNFRAQIFTGPILDEGDPVWERFKDIQYPLRFWKIAVAQTSEKELFAAAFILDQSDVIAQYGIEATVEVPFSAFKTFQTPIAEIERLTGLTFKYGSATKPKSLNDVDPLKAGSSARRAASRQRVRTDESLTASLPPGYVLLEDHSDIVFG